MLRFLADENFDNRILRGLRRENAIADIVRAQDTEIYQANDPTVLEWAAKEGRIVLTRDLRTMPHFAYERVREGKPMPGVIGIQSDAPIGTILEDLLILIGATEPESLEGQVVYIPL